MSCPVCASIKQVEFSTEMMIHHSGSKNLDNPGVLVFSKILVCSNCGFSQFVMPKTEVMMLANPTSKLTMAAAG
jgi:hypothetical protein